MRVCGKHILGFSLMLVALAGCGGGESDSSSRFDNLPPIITGTPPTTLTAGTNYSFTPQAVDPDGDALVFRASNVPGWLTFNATTGALTGTPSNANVGQTEMITIEVSDSHSVAQLPAFRIDVASSATIPPPGNGGAPTIAGVPATTATVGQIYTFTPVALDPDNNPLTFSIQNGPSWATFTASTGELRGTPAAGNVGTTSNIIISVSDGANSVELPAFNLTVSTTAPANRSPTLTGTPATSVTAGSTYTFRPVGSDPDGNTLLYSIQGQPSWATFSPTTGRLTGTPTASDVGTSPRITISVSDNIAAPVSLPSFNIQVNGTANRAPTITGTPATTVTVGNTYSFQPSASDPDGNTLTFSVSSGLPAWLTLTPSTGRLSGTPAAGDVGTVSNIVITVTDGTALVSLPAFNINVVQVANGTANVNWVIPTTNTDGTPLTDLTGFRIAYGRTSEALDESAQVNNPGATSFVVENLTSGQWFFAVVAVNAQGFESAFSNVATKTIP